MVTPTSFPELSTLVEAWWSKAIITAIITALIPVVVGGMLWTLRASVRKAWEALRKRRRNAHELRRRHSLPRVEAPFSIVIDSSRLTVTPVQPQHDEPPEGMSIARLLGAKSTSVPFLDRSGTLEELEQWAASDRPWALRLIGGEGGSGKTRLGVELCRCLTDSVLQEERRGSRGTWRAGFLKSVEKEKEGEQSQSPDAHTSLLLVMDYAETQPDTLVNVIRLTYKAAIDATWARVRILLLVRRFLPASSAHRGRDEWVDSVRPRDTGDTADSEDVNLLLDEASTTLLDQEVLSPEERERLFLNARAAFLPQRVSAGTPLELTASAPPDLSEPLFAQPLLVIIAAFLSKKGKVWQQQTDSASALFDEIITHEEHYWKQHWPSKTITFDSTIARQAVALATFTSIRSKADAIALLYPLINSSQEKLSQEEDMRLSRGQCDQIAEWLQTCYPPSMKEDDAQDLWCGHLEPDRVGEHLVISESDHLNPVLPRLLCPDRFGPSSLRTWTVVERASQNPRFKEQVGKVVDAMLVPIVRRLQSHAIESQSADLAVALASALTALFDQVSVPAATTACAELAEGGYLVASLRYVLAKRAAQIEITDDAPIEVRADYAFRLGILSSCAAEAGRRDEALETAQEATAIRRDLTTTNPAAYNPDLASSLNNLANYLSDAGRHDEALGTAQEAADRYRDLAATNPAAYNPDLAMSLNNLANYLSDAGRHDEALGTAQEATAIRRDLTATNPAAYNPDLASSLNNLANLLSDAGRHDEALETAQQAADRYRDLAATNPAAYNPDLAKSLNNLAVHLSDAGRHQEARLARQEAEELLRRWRDDT